MQVIEVKQEKHIPGNNKSTFWNVTLTTFYFGIYIAQIVFDETYTFVQVQEEKM